MKYTQISSIVTALLVSGMISSTAVAERSERPNSRSEGIEKSSRGNKDKDHRKGRKHRGEHEEKKMLRMLKHLDVNKDGTLSEEEMKNARSVMKAHHKEKHAQHKQLKESFKKKFDTNADGKLSKEEREGMKKELKAKHKAFRGVLLEKYDKDSDGKLSKAERKEAYQSERKELLNKFDTDQNGSLEGEESKKAGEWMIENRPFHFMRKHGKGGQRPKHGKRGKKSSSEE